MVMGKFLFWALVVAILIFLTIPAVVVIMSSVNPTETLAFPPKGFSLHWYARAFSYDDFRTSFYSGLIVTFFASTIASVIGVAAAYVTHRYAFRGRRLLEFLLAAPLIIPRFTTGFGFLLVGAGLGINNGYTIVIITHIVLVLPFVTRSVYVSLVNVDRSLERSAANLGASPVNVLLRITLPLLTPGIVGGWIIAAILSFTEFTASLYVTSYATQTLPVAMYTYVREYTDPTIAAISALLIITTTVGMFIVDRTLGLKRVLAIESH
jgi:putative spermidine/putrescine transport system permease protein